MKKFFAKIHLWLSIPFGIIIAIVCLTGAILVFEAEILEFCYPSRYFVKEIKSEPLSPATLMDTAREQLPDSIKINGIRVSSDPKRTYQLILPGKKAACFINPYTGEITGIDDGKGFFMKIMRLHRWLLDEYKRDGSFAWGKTIVGYSTLVLAIIIISGLVIWYPRNKKALKNRLKIKTKAGWFRFLYDLHVNPDTLEVYMQPYKYFINFIEMPVVLIIFLTGVVLVLFGIGKTVLKKTFDKGIWFAGIGTVLTVLALLLVAGYNNTAYYPSYTDLQSSLTLANSCSSEFTLKTMAYVSILVPFVIAYIFYAWRSIDRHKITEKEMDEGGHSY